MRVWVERHGRLLSRIALAAVLVAVLAPAVAMLFAIPYLSGSVPYPPINPMHVALAVSGVCAITGLAAGLAVRRIRAPGHETARIAVIVLAAVAAVVGINLLVGLTMLLTHAPQG